jgi:hypothetical protein
MAHTLGDIKKAGKRHAKQYCVNAIHALEYHALAWAKQE